MTDIIKSKISSQVASSDQIVVEISEEEFEQNVQLLMRKLEKFKNPPSISLRKIGLDDGKEHQEILEFLYAATNLRIMNFKLNMMRKYKVEEKIFQITPNLDMISSLPATMATVDLIKYCTVTIGYFFFLKGIFVKRNYVKEIFDFFLGNEEGSVQSASY